MTLLFILGIIYLLGRKETRGIVLGFGGLFIAGFIILAVIGLHLNAVARSEANEREKAEQKERQAHVDTENCLREFRKTHPEGFSFDCYPESPRHRELSCNAPDGRAVPCR